MAIYTRTSFQIPLYGDGVSTIFSYDLSKVPFTVGSAADSLVSQLVGTPSGILSTLTYSESPQIGLDVNGNPLYDQPSAVVVILGTTITITFSVALKAFGSTFTDGQSNQWPISVYLVQVYFKYGSIL